MKRFVFIVVLPLFLCAAVTTSNSLPFPKLTVTEASIGVWTFEGSEGNPIIFNLVSPASVQFTWTGDASDYGGAIVGFRTSSSCAFDPHYLGAMLGTLYYGSVSFAVEVMDDAGNITTAEFRINISSTPTPVTPGTWGEIKSLYR